MPKKTKQSSKRAQRVWKEWRWHDAVLDELSQYTYHSKEAAETDRWMYAGCCKPVQVELRVVEKKKRRGR